jgi:hypothetical protein
MTLVERLTTRPAAQRRGAAIACLVLAVGLLWGAVLDPLIWVVDSQSEWRKEVHHDLARAFGEAAGEPALRKRAATLMAEPIWSKLYEIPNGQDGTTSVQRDVLRAGATAGVKVQAVVPLPKVEEAGLLAYGIRFTTTSTADQLKRLMDALRANVGYLRVERLTLSAPQIQPADQNALLTATLEVYGFSRAHPVASP